MHGFSFNKIYVIIAYCEDIYGHYWSLSPIIRHYRL